MAQPVVQTASTAPVGTLADNGRRDRRSPGRTPLPPVLRRTGEVAPVTAVGVALAYQLLTADGWAGRTWIPLTVAVVLGLPHGAVDHLVPTWVHARRSSLGTVVGIGAAYATAAAAVLGLFVVAPTAASVAFLALSVWHFGAGELIWSERHPGGRGRPSIGTAARIITLGAIPVLLPLLRWPAEVRPVLAALSPRTAAALLEPGLRTPLLAVVVLAAAAVVLTDLRWGAGRSAAEVILLLLLVLVVPPLAAFAVYFGAWHALRHLLRLLAADPANRAALADGRIGAPARRFLRLAALPTLASLLLLGGLWLTSDGPVDFVAADLRLLAALTVPHMVVVAWFDRRTVR